MVPPATLSHFKTLIIYLIHTTMTTSFLKILPALVLACSLFSLSHGQEKTAALLNPAATVNPHPEEAPEQLKPAGWGVLRTPDQLPDTIGNPWFGTTTEGELQYNRKPLLEAARPESSKKSWAYSLVNPC